MPFCPHCGKAIDQGNMFCPHCGGKIGPSDFISNIDPVSEVESRTFIGKNADHYWRKFQSFRSTGHEGFAFTWSWSAFFLGFIWMLYRKMYLWALLAFVIALTPVTFPLLMIGWGLTGNYIYFWHARKKILEHRSYLTSGISSQSLADLGGVNGWIWFVGVILFLFLLTIGFMGLLLLLFLIREIIFYVPQFIQT